jgi:hypothetical protein
MSPKALQIRVVRHEFPSACLDAKTPDQRRESP